MKKIPVIIDCDPGYDDALALVLALGSEKLDVKALTATAGNQTIERTYKNTVRICNFLKKDIRIGKGVSKPLFRELHVATKVHGESGLDGSSIPEEVPMPAEESAVVVMKDILEKAEEKITLIPIGPLTNVALLLLTYPEVKDKIDSIVIMGGAASVGNATPSAEFNIYADAEAAKLVFESSIPIVMAGLDVTNGFQIHPEEFEGYRQFGLVGEFVAEILDNYNIFYQTLGKKFRGPAIHDMLAIAYVIDPSIFRGEDYHVDIECKGEFTYGRTVVDFSGRNVDKNVKVLFECEEDCVIDMFKEAIKNYRL